MAHDKDKGFKNELEVSLVYFNEQIDRAQYFNHISIDEHKILKNMTQDFINAVHKVIGEEEPKNQKVLDFAEEENEVSPNGDLENE